MNLLIIDDCDIKTLAIREFCVTNFDDVEVEVCSNAADGFIKLMEGEYGLVLLDLFLPLNNGAKPSLEGSKWFARELVRKSESVGYPYVVGITQFPDAIRDVEDEFCESLLSVIKYSSTAQWQDPLTYAVQFARQVATQVKIPRVSGDVGDVDFALICALRSPEYCAITQFTENGRPFILEDTAERWITSTIPRKAGGEAKVLLACADGMGMTCMSSLITKVSICCRPRYVILYGIMAGNCSRVAMSDLVIALSTWNMAAGKLTTEGFVGDVQSENCTFRLSNMVENAISDEFLLEFWKNSVVPKPNCIPKLHKGDVACSPYVASVNDLYNELENKQKRKILGLEMEAYGCYEAARRLGSLAPEVLCLKSVCDFGGEEKSDDFQKYCAELSAAAVIEVVKSDTW